MTTQNPPMAQMPDAYRSEDRPPTRRFIVFCYPANAPMISFYVDADTYADAVNQVYPGNDLAKIEVIGV